MYWNTTSKQKRVFVCNAYYYVPITHNYKKMPFNVIDFHGHSSVVRYYLIHIALITMRLRTTQWPFVENARSSNMILFVIIPTAIYVKSKSFSFH